MIRMQFNSKLKTNETIDCFSVKHKTSAVHLDAGKFFESKIIIFSVIKTIQFSGIYLVYQPRQAFYVFEILQHDKNFQ